MPVRGTRVIMRVVGGMLVNLFLMGIVIVMRV
jgi:hypothetical protein